MSREHREEVAAGERFGFGANWLKLLPHLTDERVDEAIRSLRTALGLESLDGRSFLDIGCGSGLFSLAARRLGARVHSFDFDVQSVACTRALRERHFPGDPAWSVEEGSVLDAEYLSRLGRFDVVYSWGVLHHTGSMWEALANAQSTVALGGLFYVAIYNDQGWVSRYWTLVKRAYNRGIVARFSLTALHAPYLFGARVAVRAASGRLRLERGMSIWRDMVDWLGGYPFEVATPEAIFDHCSTQGLVLRRLRTCRGRMGCNEFVFQRAVR